MVPLVKPYLQMACEMFSLANGLFCIMDCGQIYFFFFFFGRLEENQFNHLYENEEKASPTSRATNLALQGNISHSKKYVGMFLIQL